MLTLVNSYAHGYVAIPVILACKKQGLFRMFDAGTPVPFTALVTRLHANRGHLRTALHLLESLRWVTRNEQDEYVLTSNARVRHKISQDTLQLLSFPMDAYLLNHQSGLSLTRWIEKSERRWNIKDALIARILDGMLVIPLLLALKAHHLLPDPERQEIPLFSTLPPGVCEEVTTFFHNQGWLSQENGVHQLTDTGRFLTERIFITATVASYRPMLMKIAEVIFGDCRSVFVRDQSDHEQHVDRTLNVRGSGFQHDKYFSDMEAIILSIFNRKPYQEQPKYIADTGCGDGTLLKTLYEIVQHKSLRGSVLHDYPLRLIGIDWNEKALEATKLTLKDCDHLILQGDIGNPAQIIADLEKIGVHDPENILHVRSFLDHDRPYLPPSDPAAVTGRSHLSSDAVFVANDGGEIPVSKAMQSLVEHLRRWSSVLGRHGLILLEVHCLPLHTVNEHLETSESLSFDAFHRFSHQLLVEADRFLMAAAEAGLFPRKELFRKYPHTLPFSRITLNYFEHRNYRVRYAQEKDLPALTDLEQQCWEQELRTSETVLTRRVQTYPEGQLALELAQKVVGVLYSQRVHNLEEVNSASVTTVERLHSPEGSIVQLLSVNILPEMQHQNLGDQLLECMLQYCTLMNGIHAVIGVTRCKNYHLHKGMTPQDYINLRNEQSGLIDPTLRFHELHGAHHRAGA